MSSKIVLYKGRRGSGKSLTMVKDGVINFKKGWDILRNFDCAFGKPITNEQILNLDKFSEIRKCIILVEEIQIFFDSRRSMKTQNIQFSNFIQQVRKRDISIYATSQYANTVDLRFRQHVDIVALPKYDDKLKVCEVTYIDMTSKEDILDSFDKPHISARVVYDARPIFPLYNTREMQK